VIYAFGFAFKTGCDTIRGSGRNDSAATPRAANNNSSTLMTRCVPLLMQDNCTAPDRFLVESSCHCGSHELMAMVWWPLVVLQQENVIITASPRRTTSLVASPEYTPVSREHTPTPVRPSGSFIRTTMAVRSGALPFYNNIGGGSNNTTVAAPPDFIDLEPASPPLAPWAPGC
jgi:hypothetical protein